MLRISTRRTFILPLGLGLAALSVYAADYNAKPRMANYSFDYGGAGVPENPGIQVLNYRYGNSKLPGTYVEDAWIGSPQVSQGRATYGWMPIGGTLYVKWRILATGKVYEHTVNLMGRLPSDMEGKIVHFAIKGKQLIVYVVEGNNSAHFHAKGAPDCPVPVYQDFKCTRIYPDHWANFGPAS